MMKTSVRRLPQAHYTRRVVRPGRPQQTGSWHYLLQRWCLMTCMYRSPVMVLAVPAGLAATHQVDLGDARFAQLYTADDFALDPTDPRFKACTSTFVRHSCATWVHLGTPVGSRRQCQIACL